MLMQKGVDLCSLLLLACYTDSMRFYTLTEHNQINWIFEPKVETLRYSITKHPCRGLVITSYFAVLGGN